MFRLVFSLVSGLASLSAGAQTFDSGSTGAAGPIDVPYGQTVTYAVPPDGVIHATTVTVAGTLRFTCNAKNTPVYLLATGDVKLEAGGTNSSVISVTPTGVASGLQGQAGGCGGFSGGDPGVGGVTAGDGYGPGGGKGRTLVVATGGSGAYGTASGSPPVAQQGVAYGTNLLVPLVGGSGGGGGASGGGAGGGGAILVASNTRIVLNGSNRRIEAIGGSRIDNDAGSGSGGAIRLVAPRIEGNGTLSVAGGSPGGGTGRIRIDTLDRSGFFLQGLNAGTYSIGSFMEVFPSEVPSLDFTSIAGTAISDGSNPVPVLLLPTASPNQSLTLRARNFDSSASVAVRVVLTPASGPRIVLDDSIDMAGQPTATKVFNFTMQPDMLYRVHAWTR